MECLEHTAKSTLLIIRGGSLGGFCKFSRRVAGVEELEGKRVPGGWRKLFP